MGDCGLNVDFNAAIIDHWQRQTYQNTKKQPKPKSWENSMRSVRIQHICHICRQYPGDDQYIYGKWENASYKCFDCL